MKGSTALAMKDLIAAGIFGGLAVAGVLGLMVTNTPPFIKCNSPVVLEELQNNIMRDTDYPKANWKWPIVVDHVIGQYDTGYGKCEVNVPIMNKRISYTFMETDDKMVIIKYYENVYDPGKTPLDFNKDMWDSSSHSTEDYERNGRR